MSFVRYGRFLSRCERRLLGRAGIECPDPFTARQSQFIERRLPEQPAFRYAGLTVSRYSHRTPTLSGLSGPAVASFQVYPSNSGMVSCSKCIFKDGGDDLFILNDLFQDLLYIHFRYDMKAVYRIQ